jgi:hypothetical protein
MFIQDVCHLAESYENSRWKQIPEPASSLSGYCMLYNDLICIFCASWCYKILHNVTNKFLGKYRLQFLAETSTCERFDFE